MSGDWQIKKLRDVCTLINGRAYSKSELLSEGKYPVLRVGNFFTNNNWYYSNFELPPEKYCGPGDLLYAWSASFGPRIWEGDKVIFHYHIWKVQPEVGLIDQRYLFYFFEWDTEQIKLDQGTGTTMIHVAKGSMEDRDVPVPSLPTQRRIVAILDEAFDGIATAKVNAEKNLQNARELFESQLDSELNRHADGYVATTLGSEVDLLAGYAFSSGSYSDAAGDIRLLRGDNIMQGYLRWEDAKRWPASDCAAYARFALREGDVVLAMDRPWVKAGLKRAQISGEDLPCLQVQRTARLRPRQALREDFLFHLTGSQSFSRHLLEVQTGIGVPHISGKQIESFKFMRPPLNEQASIAGRLSELHESTQQLTEISQRKLTALEELKKSLLHQAFSGQL